MVTVSHVGHVLGGAIEPSQDEWAWRGGEVGTGARGAGLRESVATLQPRNIYCGTISGPIACWDM